MAVPGASRKKQIPNSQFTMATVDKIFLATLTKNEDDSGIDAGPVNLIINIEGEDVADINFGFMKGSGWLSEGLGPDSGWLDEGQAAILEGSLLNPIESALLTNSSIRVGIRSDDAWSPRQIVVLGNTERRVLALAMETEIENSLSNDRTEGKLTMPIRLVGAGNSSTLIRRVMVLIYTWSGGATDSRIQLQITAAGNLVLQQEIPDTPQDDLEDYTANWYTIDVAAPFSRGDLFSNGGMRLITLGTDAFTPRVLLIYGLDTASGRPNEVVHLVSVTKWTLGTLSTDDSEGETFIDLPVV